MVPLWTIYSDPNKGSRHLIWGTVCISEVNGAMNVKSNAQVAMNKNSDRVQKFYRRMAGEDSAPNSNFFKLLELSEASRARKLILWPHVNIDKVNSRTYDVSR